MSKQDPRDDVQDLLEGIAKENLVLHDIKSKKIVEEWNGISKLLDAIICKTVLAIETKDSNDNKVTIKDNLVNSLCVHDSNNVEQAITKKDCVFDDNFNYGLWLTFQEKLRQLEFESEWLLLFSSKSSYNYIKLSDILPLVCDESFVDENENSQDSWSSIEDESDLNPFHSDSDNESHNDSMEEDNMINDILDEILSKSWNDFENEICNGDNNLMEQCKIYCLRLDKKL